MWNGGRVLRSWMLVGTRPAEKLGRNVKPVGLWSQGGFGRPGESQQANRVRLSRKGRGRESLGNFPPGRMFSSPGKIFASTMKASSLPDSTCGEYFALGKFTPPRILIKHLLCAGHCQVQARGCDYEHPVCTRDGPWCFSHVSSPAAPGGSSRSALLSLFNRRED